MVWLTALLTIVGSAVGAWFGARLSLQNYHAQRIWDRRAEAYSAIFGAVDGMHQWFAENLQDQLDLKGYRAEVADARHKTFQESKVTLSRLLAREAWVVPERTQEIINRLNRTLDNDQPELWDVMLARCNDAFNLAVDELKRAAHEDMDVETPVFALGAGGTFRPWLWGQRS